MSTTTLRIQFLNIDIGKPVKTTSCLRMSIFEKKKRPMFEIGHLAQDYAQGPY